MEFIKAVESRRSIYGLKKESPITKERITEIVKIATKHVPSEFNSQNQKVVLLFSENHNKLWDITMETLRKIVPADKFSGTEQKINIFKSGYGTVLYFNDDAITESLIKQYPLYADSFPQWAEQSNGMLQFAVWSILESEGLGANLQHYNPLIDEEVKKAFHIPKEWRLIAQMPFGSPMGMPGEKEFKDIDTRVKVL